MTNDPISRKPIRNRRGNPWSRQCRRKLINSVLGRSDVGRKWRDSGRIRQNISAEARAKQPITASAMRQLKRSVKTPLSKRPLMPPIELPLIYSPIENATKLGWISSLR
ncbi:hypothetical protein D3C76_1162400 [compost metagenome]